MRASTLSLVFFLMTATLRTAFAATITGGTLIEDFTDATHWDAANSTGLWNLDIGSLQAGRVMGAVATQTLNFGDGSDGTVDTADGYTFDTDQHPNGYQFARLKISGGTIAVTGSNPLVIRSLSTIQLSPTLSVKGADGTAGTANGLLSGSAGGLAIGGKCQGGKGGDANPSGNGGNGLKSDSSSDTTGSAGVTGASHATSPGTSLDLADARANWGTTSTALRCGAGGAGGGGHTNGGNYATGGAGGAGGGTLRLIAAGSITYTQLDVRGGNGGAGANDGFCSGSGAGGNGGGAWIQSLKSITGPAPLFTGGSNASCSGSSGAGIDGDYRMDSELTSDSGAFETGNVAPSQTYLIQTLSYDLGTKNAGFSTVPTLDTTLNGGTISVSYSGSSDGSLFSDYSENIIELNNKNYRYLKLKVTIQTPASAGPSPQLNSVQISYTELSVRLLGACGSLEISGDQNKRLILGSWITFWILTWGFLTRRLPYRLSRSPSGIHR